MVQNTQVQAKRLFIAYDVFINGNPCYYTVEAIDRKDLWGIVEIDKLSKSLKVVATPGVYQGRDSLVELNEQDHYWVFIEVTEDGNRLPYKTDLRKPNET